MDFDSYEEEYLQTSRRVNKLLNQLQNSREIRTSLPLIAKTDNEISELKGYICALEIEIDNVNIDQRDVIERRLGRYKRELKQSVGTFEDLRKRSERSYKVKNNRGINSLNNAADYLDSSAMLLSETEQIGGNVMRDLESQHETLLGAQKKVLETKLFTIEADKTLTIMGRRAIGHKACLLLSIVILMGLNILVIYYAFIKK